jgi:hypothetical protein
MPLPISPMPAATPSSADVGIVVTGVPTPTVALDRVSSAKRPVTPTTRATPNVDRYVVPSTGSILDLAAPNFTTALGALCFFIGALLLLPRQHADASRVPPTRLRRGITMSRGELIGQLDALTKRYVNHFLLEPAREDRGSSMLPRKNSSAAISPFGGSRSGANIARRSPWSIIHAAF